MGEWVTLMTTAVTDLSEQKKVLERRAYCSENFLIISTDLSASPPAARPRKIAFSVRLGRGKKMIQIGIGDLVHSAYLEPERRISAGRPWRRAPGRAGCWRRWW
jgi:hypothetical protein